MNTVSSSGVKLCLLVLAFFVGQPIIQAQVSTGTILGVVHDSSGAVVPGASVTARETATNQARTVTTGGDGVYRFDALPVGTYEVTATANGFATAVQSGLTLAVGQEAVTDFTLQVGTGAQTVSVTAAANLVSTTTSSLSSLVTPETISNLPLNGRNYVSLTLLQPGVTQSTISGSSVVGYAGTEFSADGAPFRSNAYLLDGTILNNMFNANGASATGTTLGVDGIQEYSVVTNAYPAEYGWDMGSQQIIVSKSGTNAFHGDVYEFLRNSSLDAKNYFDLPPSASNDFHRLPEFRRNQFGGSLGGPIQKNKTFFFATYEGLRASTGQTEVEAALAPGCHGGAGAVITVANCPQIAPTPSVTVAPQMAPFVALYPLPNLAKNQYGYVFTQNESEDYAQMRVDHIFSSSDSMFVRYTADNSYLPSNANNFNESYITESSLNQFITLAENHIFSSNLLNSARLSYSGSPIVQGQSEASNSFFKSPTYELVAGYPMGNVSPGIVGSIGASATDVSEVKSIIASGADDLDYNRGRHSMKFGLVFNWQRYITANGGYVWGNATMNGITGLLTGAMTTFGGVVGPLGIAPYANIPAGPPNNERVYDFDTMGFYAEDSWRITPRLTLNGGMRYEPTTTVTEIHNRSYAIRNPTSDAAFTQGPPFINPSLRNWGPRVGFAWDVFGDGKTALRGGFGILFDQANVGSSLFLEAEDTPPYSEQYTLAGGTLTIPNPPPPPDVFPYQSNGMAYHWNQPHMLSYNLTVERQLPGQIGLTVAFAGSRGINLVQTNEGNPVIPTGVPTANGSGECVAAPAGSTPITLAQASAPSASQLDGSATSCYLAASPRANPNTDIASLTDAYATGDSIYNSLEVNAVKNVTHGLQFQSSYTWGRVIDDGQGESFVDVNRFFREPLHKASDRAVSDQNIEQAFNLDALYYLPNVSGSKTLVNKFANGWYLGPIVSLYSGHVFSLTMTGNRQLTGQLESIGTPSSYPDVVPGRTGYNITHGVSSGCSSIAAGTRLHTQELWYDPCAYSIQPTGFIGTEPRNQLVGPGYADLDFAVVKDTAAPRLLGEAGQIEFRSEFFNILNHANFANPITTLANATCGGSALACTFGPLQPVSSTAGVIEATNGTSREIQFALKLIF